MNFYISDPILDKQITEIRRKILLSMNGVVSEQMKEKGIIYKRNYGVIIPRLKEIASSYIPNHDLAQRLWNIQIRETMLLAILLEPVENFTYENAIRWAEHFNQIEIIEYACMNLLSKVPYSDQLCNQWINSDQYWLQVTGFTLASRIYLKLDNKGTDQLITKAFELSATCNLHLYRAISICLSRFCRINNKIAIQIESLNNKLSKSLIPGQQFIYNEVSQELKYLDTL